MSSEMLVEDQAEIQNSPLAAATTAASPAIKSLPRENPQGMPKLGYKAQAQKGFNWFTTGFMILFHVCAIAALFMFTWKALICAVVLWVLATNVGIGMCYHRLLTHRGYRVPKWLEYILAVCGTMALEGGPIFWVSLHRVHHQLSDHDGDPHTPHEGGWWSHVGWILIGDSLNTETDALARYVPDLTRDRFYCWLSKYHWVPLVIVAVALYFIGGWPCVFWGIFLRTTLGLHATWLVNSATHMWGSRRFETRDDSRNNWWVALITGGEGWHNNHHAHPVSARHGLKWYELDVNYLGIWLLRKLGLAHEIKVAQYDPHNPRPAGVA
ncbi:MAG: fatty acid desaturase [Candidatus Binataceae bacterium]